MGVGVEVLPGAAPGRVVLEVLLVLDLPAQVDEVRLAVAVWVDPDGAPGVEGGEVERDAVEVLVPGVRARVKVRARVRAWDRPWVRVRVRARVRVETAASPSALPTRAARTQGRGRAPAQG